MARHIVPAQETRSEIRVANSRFIATLGPVFSLEEAKAFVARLRAEFHDASHNVPAYVIGHGPSVIAHSNDDGEPPGTAGRPALAVLQGSGLGDAAVIVSRYFGGTKLGTGGLVRAYGDAVRAVLAETPRAEKVTAHTVMVATPYKLFEQVRLLAENHGGRVLEEEFAAEVSVSLQFRAEQLPPFQAALQELSHGAISAEILETNRNAILPL